MSEKQPGPDDVQPSGKESQPIVEAQRPVRHASRPLPFHVRYGPYIAGALLLAGGGFTIVFLTGAVAWSWGFVDTEDGMGIFVMGLFNLVLAGAGTVGGVLAIARRRWAFALLGGLLGIFVAPHLSIPAVILLFFAEDGFLN